MSSETLGTVVVVDDDPSTLLLAQDALVRSGIVVETIESSQACQERLKRNSVALAIIDLQLPKMSGDALALWIRQHHPTIDIVMLTDNIEGARNAVPSIPVIPKTELKSDPRGFVTTVWNRLKFHRTDRQLCAIGDALIVTQKTVSENSELVKKMFERMDAGYRPASSNAGTGGEKTPLPSDDALPRVSRSLKEVATWTVITALLSALGLSQYASPPAQSRPAPPPMIANDSKSH